MKHPTDYFARVQECMLLFLTNAAFLLQLSQNTNANAKLLMTASELSEKVARGLLGLLPQTDRAHLNPACLKKASGDSAKDLTEVRSDFLRLQRRVLLLASYAPDFSTRKLLLRLSRETRAIMHLLDFI